MTTISYPIEGVNLDGDQWSKLLRRQHQGVDAGMSLSLSSTSNDATLSTGRANFLGFEIEVTTAHVVTLAASTGSPVTYVIGVLYNPANAGLDPNGPLSIVSGVKGSISIPGGGVLWPLYEVTRYPSTTLNLSDVTSFRVFRASLLYTATGVTPPDPAYAQGAQVLVTRTGLKVADGGVWYDVKADTGYQSNGFVARSGWSDQGCAYRILNGVVTLHLRALRSGTTITANSSGSLSDSPMIEVPTPVRQSWLVTGGGTLTTASSSTLGFDWRLSQSGVWSITSASPNTPIANGTVLYATATYPL